MRPSCPLEQQRQRKEPQLPDIEHLRSQKSCDADQWEHLKPPWTKYLSSSISTYLLAFSICVYYSLSMPLPIPPKLPLDLLSFLVLHTPLNMLLFSSRWNGTIVLPSLFPTPLSSPLSSSHHSSCSCSCSCSLRLPRAVAMAAEMQNGGNFP